MAELNAFLQRINSEQTSESQAAKPTPREAFRAAADPSVTEAQAYLRVLGYASVGKINGIQGDRTNLALAQFKEANGLDAQASLADVTKLLKEKALSPEGQDRLNAIIDGANPKVQSQDVRAAQVALNAMNTKDFQIEVDGFSGPQTVWGSEKLKDNLSLSKPTFAPGIIDLGEIIVRPEPESGPPEGPIAARAELPEAAPFEGGGAESYSRQPRQQRDLSAFDRSQIGVT